MSNSGINRQTTAVAEDTSSQPIPDNSVGGGEGWGDRLWLGGKEEGLGHKVVRDWGPVQRLPAYVDESGISPHRLLIPDQRWGTFLLCKIRRRVGKTSSFSVRTWLILTFNP